MKGKNSEIERGRSNRNELPKNLCIIIALEGSKTELNFQKRSLYKMSRWWTVKRAEAVWWKIPFSRGSIGAGGGWALGGFQKEEEKVLKKVLKEKKSAQEKKILFRGSIGAGGGWTLGGILVGTLISVLIFGFL